MCGLAGVIDLGFGRIEPSVLIAMTDAVHHRGPDDEGYVLIDQRTSESSSHSGPDSPAEIRATLPSISDRSRQVSGNIGIGHRRFSIIDLSSAGHQPFIDAAKRVAVVFNGEIYNYVEVRAELEGLGVIFRSHSDTEVLAEAYKAWGTGCFERLNGFWGLALYDFTTRQLILSRDRIGKKPVYWTRCGSRVYFASEIKALLAAPEVSRSRKVNESAIGPWLSCGLRDMDYTTFYDGIHSLEAGSWAVVDDSFPASTTSFWQVPRERMSESDLDIRETADALRETLVDAVRIRLRADVPLCVELSGGMDSSALAAIAAGLMSKPVTTYTVRFKDPAHNEEPFARSVAEAIGADYRVVDSPTERFWPQIDAFTRLSEEPYHSPVLQTNQVIWTLMRAGGTKVSLNGAAGDELFAGYSRYFYSAQTENLRHGRFGVAMGNELHWSESSRSLRPSSLPLVRLARYAANRAVFRNDGSGTNVDVAASALGQRRQVLPDLSDILYQDMTRTLMPYWLRSGDKDYMGIPLEVRAPFLDYRVIEFAMRLPTTFLIRDGWHKWILRKALEGVVPDDVLWRRRKMGFPFPYERFLADSSAILDVIRAKADNPYVDAASIDVAGHKSWYALSFILWYERFFNDNDALFDRIEELGRDGAGAADYGFSPQFLSLPSGA